jgi:hypothetical protein
MSNPLSRFVVVGKIKGNGEIERYNEGESRLATAIFKADLEDADNAKEIIFSVEGIAKVQAESEATVKLLFGEGGIN